MYKYNLVKKAQNLSKKVLIKKELLDLVKKPFT